MSFVQYAMVGKMGMDISPFAHSMLEATSLAQLFPAVVTEFIANPILGAIGAFKELAGSVQEAIANVAESSHDLDVLSQRAGVSAKFLGSLSGVAKSTNLALEDLAHGLSFLNNNAADAAAGSKTAQAAFAAIGVSAVDVAGNIKPTEELFREVVDAISDLPTPAQQTQAAMNLMSRAGLSLLPVLRQGTEGLDELAATMRAASGGMSDDLVGISNKAVELHHVWEAAWTGIERAVATPFLRIIAADADHLQASIISAASAMRGAIGSAFDFIASHAQVIGAALAGVGIALAAVFAPAIIVASVGAIVSAVAALAAVLATPIGIAIALGAAVGALAQHFGLIHPAIDWVKGTAIPVIESGFSQALTALEPAGRIASAAIDVVYSGLKSFVGWIAAVAAPAIGTVLGGAIHFLQPVFTAAGGVVKVFLSILGEMYSYVVGNVVPLFSQVMHSAVAGMQPIFHGLGSVIQGLMPIMQALFSVGRAVLVGLYSVVASSMGAWWSITKTVGGELIHLSSILIDLVSPAVKFFGNIIGWCLDKLGSFLGAIGRAAIKLTELLGLSGDAASSPPPSAPTQEEKNAIAPIAPSIADAVEAAPKVSDTVGQAMDSLGGNIDGVSNSATKFKTTFKTAVTDVLSNATDVAQPFLDVLKQIGDQLQQIGQPLADAMTAMSSPGLAGAGGGGSSATVNQTNHFHVAPLDGEKASSQIAAKLAPQLRAAQSKAQTDLDNAAKRAAHQSGLGG